MQLTTHKLIGDYLFEQLNRTYHGALDRHYFVLGNLLPDLDRKYMAMNHYKEECWEYLFGLIRQFNTVPNRKGLKSEALGIICHFVADSFCKVHNKPYQHQVSLVGHVLYEVQLHSRFREVSRSIPLGGHSLDDLTDALDIESLHQEYLSETPDFGRDITFALRACLMVCEMCLERAYAHSDCYGYLRTSNQWCDQYAV